MLARFFQKSEPISFVSLLFLLFVFIIIRFFIPLPTGVDLGFVLQSFSVFLFFTFVVFLANFIIEKNHLTSTNFYAIFIFVLILGLFPTVFSFSKISLSHLFILLAVRRIYSIRSKKLLLSKLFDSGFYMGVAFLLYPLSFLYVLLIYVSYFIYKKIIDKNLLLPLIGFLTPVFIVFTYFYVFDKLSVFISLIEININFEILEHFTTSSIIPIMFIMGILIIALLKIITKWQSFDGKDKNSTKLIVAHLLISMFILLTNNLKIEYTIQFIFFPSAILIGDLLFLVRKNWIKNLLLYSLVILAFVVPFL